LPPLHSIDLRLGAQLKELAFRRAWFRAELEAKVPEMFRDLREFRDLTQSDMAQLAGMKQSAVSRFEKSRDATWKLETLLTLAEALDAQLSITLEASESVIARYEREEARPTRIGHATVGAEQGSEFNAKKISAGEKARPPAGRSQQSVLKREDRPWN
jgi:transcriptional regulator with XRE-family HTH domain